MPRLLQTLLAFCLMTIAYAAPPPLLDRELFFGDPEVSGAQLSPDGKYLAFLKPYNKTRNIWVKKVEEPFSAAKPVTNDTQRPISGYFWSRNGKYLLFAQDKSGDENFNVYAVDPAAQPAGGSAVPPARDLTNLKGVRVAIYAVPKSDPDVLYIGLNDRDKAWHDLYRLTISTGEKTLLRKNTDRVVAWIFDNKDQLRLAMRSADNGDTEVLRVDPQGFAKLYSCGVLESCGPMRFHADNKRVYLLTNKGVDVNLTRILLFDPSTSREEAFESDPDKRVDFSGSLFSDVDDRLLATFYNDDRMRIYWKDKAFASDNDWLKTKLPGKEVRWGSRTRDEQMWLIQAMSDAEPGETYLFDRRNKKLTLQFRLREQLPREHLAHMQPIRYKSSDGLEIPAYLTLPVGVEPKNLPLMVVPHGGPWARDSWGYNSLGQFLANRGYAVLEPNFRGSTGYGKKFVDAGNGEWGRKMQDDLTWGVTHLVKQGTVNPKRVGIMGGSYGGYATLAGAAFTPDVYAAAVSIVGPSNLETLLGSIPPYWEAARKQFSIRMGDMNTAEGKAQLQRQSPLHAAAKIKTPLLVAQGANDPRVKQAESDQIVVALRDRNFPVEYLVAPDEGHGFARPVNNMALFMAAEKFLAKHLDGRSQESASPEVLARLREITVDPKTVTLTKKVDAAAVTAPKPAVDLQPGSRRYQASIQAGGQTMKLTLATTVKEENGAWTVVDTMQTPMGEATDTAVLEKGTLLLQKRDIQQGPIRMHIAVTGGQVKGGMSRNGQDTPIAVDAGGPLFADAAGIYQAVASLPLAEGYTTTFRNFDLQRQQAKLQRLTVVGSEKVTVPAGEFEAYRVELTSADGGADKATLWIAKTNPRTLKLQASLPSMGGVTLTAELLE